MENIDAMNELEDMRAQMALLKEKLSKEEILNDKLLKNATKNNMSTIRRQKLISYAAAVYVLTFGNITWWEIGMPLYFLIGTSVLMIICAIATYLMHRRFEKTDVINGNLLEVAKNAKSLKIGYAKWRRYAIPGVMIWLSWFAYEQLTVHDYSEYAIIMVASCTIGGIVGGIWGNMMHRKVVRVCNDIIRQIEE